MSIVRRLSTAEAGFEGELSLLLAFEATQDDEVDRTVAQILADVRERGDAAVLEHTRRLDRSQAASMSDLEVPRDKLTHSLAGVSQGWRPVRAPLRAQ